MRCFLEVFFLPAGPRQQNLLGRENVFLHQAAGQGFVLCFHRIDDLAMVACRALKMRFILQRLVAESADLVVEAVGNLL